MGTPLFGINIKGKQLHAAIKWCKGVNLSVNSQRKNSVVMGNRMVCVLASLPEDKRNSGERRLCDSQGQLLLTL